MVYLSQQPELPKTAGHCSLRGEAGSLPKVGGSLLALCKETWAFVRQKRECSQCYLGLIDFKEGNF